MSLDRTTFKELFASKEDAARAILAIASAIQKRGAEVQRFFVLEGSPAEVRFFCSLLFGILGENHVSEMDLERLESVKFAREILCNKKAVILTEEGDYKGGIGWLEAITGGDDLSVKGREGEAFRGVVFLVPETKAFLRSPKLQRRSVSLNFRDVLGEGFTYSIEQQMDHVRSEVKKIANECERIPLDHILEGLKDAPSLEEVKPKEQNHFKDRVAYFQRICKESLDKTAEHLQRELAAPHNHNLKDASSVIRHAQEDVEGHLRHFFLHVSELLQAGEEG